MTSYYAHASERAAAHEQDEPQVLRDDAIAAELAALCGHDRSGIR